jgi:hypothetical protein
MANKIKKLAKLGVLMSIKEGYLFVRNVYGIYTHPFLTTKKIVKGKDWSQGILIFGLPFYLWLGWVLVLLSSRLFIFGRLQFGFFAKASFLACSFFVSVLLAFLGYWILEVRKERK